MYYLHIIILYYIIITYGPAAWKSTAIRLERNISSLYTVVQPLRGDARIRLIIIILGRTCQLPRPIRTDERHRISGQRAYYATVYLVIIYIYASHIVGSCAYNYYTRSTS